MFPFFSIISFVSLGFNLFWKKFLVSGPKFFMEVIASTSHSLFHNTRGGGGRIKCLEGWNGPLSPAISGQNFTTLFEGALSPQPTWISGDKYKEYRHFFFNLSLFQWCLLLVQEMKQNFSYTEWCKELVYCLIMTPSWKWVRTFQMKTI